MQLDAFLQSVERFRVPYASVTVLGVGPSEAYRPVARLHPDVFWAWDEWDGHETTVRAFLEQHERVVVFHTDDDVFYRPVPYWDGLDLDSTILSLRLGWNTIRCHPRYGAEQRLPGGAWTAGGPFFAWEWRGSELDFGYPLSLNGHVFRSEWLLELLEDVSFANPTELEAQLAARADGLHVETMTAPWYSCVVSLAWNVVSGSSGNPHRGPSAAELLERWQYGYRMDLDAMDFRTVDAAHMDSIVPVLTRRRLLEAV